MKLHIVVLCLKANRGHNGVVHEDAGGWPLREGQKRPQAWMRRVKMKAHAYVDCCPLHEGHNGAGMMSCVNMLIVVLCIVLLYFWYYCFWYH